MMEGLYKNSRNWSAKFRFN